MKKKSNYEPTPAELEILEILWQHGPSTVRYINDKLNEQREVGYTTTLKIMQLMTEKNILRRDESSRSHVYHPVIKEKITKQALLDKFLESAFGGSALKLVTQALGNHKPSKEEINKIREFLDELEGEEK